LWEMGGNGDKRKFFKIVGLQGRRGSWDFALDVEEDEGNRGETSGNKSGENGRCRLEKVRVWEKK